MNEKNRKRLSLYVLLSSCLIGLGYSTQYFAKEVGYSYQLGKEIINIKGVSFYSPFSILVWIKYFNNIVPEELNKALLYLYISIFIGIFIIFIINFKAKTLTSHGSASWADEETIKNKANLKPMDKDIYKEYEQSKTKEIYQKTIKNKNEFLSNGVVLGKDKKGNEYRHLGVEHILVMAPTRSGKGVGIVLPTLWTWKGSVFINDIKEENYNLTAKYRESIGQKVLKFKPASINDSCSYNPLAEINLGTESDYQDSIVIADILVDTGKNSDPHWSENAKNFLICIIMYVCYNKSFSRYGANLRDIYSFITDPTETITQKVEKLISSDTITCDGDKKFTYDNDKYKSIFHAIYGHIVTIDGKERPFIHPSIFLMAGKIKNTPEKELGSIISTAITNLQIFIDPAINKNTSKSDFKIRDLMFSDTPISLYFVVRPRDLFIARTILKLITTQLVNELTVELGTNKRLYNHRLLLLLDEFPAIGRLSFFETSLAFIAGYGLKVLLITQEIKQIIDIYGENNKIIGNCHIQVYFTPNDERTPKLISEKLGNKTIIEKSLSYKGFKYLSNWNWSERAISRALMTSAEVAQMDMNDEIIFVTGLKPIKAKKIKWYETPMYIERSNRKGEQR